ncbi:MAG: hypothetical protein HPY50_13565 [Firmicutes bacterium]|nr:hypothetical protein [Bacillota bacterium]
MRHTYLFKEGSWEAKGTYYDQLNREYPVNGESTITHEEKLWINQSSIRLLGIDSSELVNRYQVVPFSGDVTEWSSFDPSMGLLYGRYIVVRDTIISNFRSEDGVYSGTECMIKLYEHKYQVRGFIFKGNSKVSSWSLTLTAKFDRGNWNDESERP